MDRARRWRLAALLSLLVAQVACATVPSPPAHPTLQREPSPGERARTALARGEALLAQGDVAAAAAAFREALALEPGLARARSALGRALYGAGDLEAAVEELRRTLAQAPGDATARSTLAAALIARRDWNAAKRELEELVRRHPDHAEAHYGLGLVRYAERDLAGAAEAYRRVLMLQPDHHDARANLALVLKVSRREAEATPEFLAAAAAGVARAQYFAGVAYADGLGVDRSLPVAIGWWMRAAEQGVVAAEEALASLRQVAVGRSRRPGADRQAVERAFREYRAALWSEVPDGARDAAESAGAALLRHGRVAEAVTTLIREAGALDDSAQRRLEALYEQGVPGVLAPYDARILAWFETAAGEGLTRPRIALARVYGRGLGVPQDVPRALALLHATPHEDARRLLEELTP